MERFSRRFVSGKFHKKLSLFHVRYLIFHVIWRIKVDSIFYLRRPDDLVAFLNQFDYRQTINSINAQLLSLQMEITDKVQQSTFFQVSWFREKILVSTEVNLN